MVAEERTRRTFYYELWRAGTAGILEAAGSTFLLLIAVSYFQAGAFSKAMVAGGSSVGLLLSPVVVSIVTAAQWPVSKAASRILAAGAVAFLLAAIWPVLPVFVLCSVAASACATSVIPLLTHMYQENYPVRQRGQRFSRTFMIRIAAAALFAKVAGDALTGRIDDFPWLLLVFAAAAAFASFCLRQCPTNPIVSDGRSHPLSGMRFVRTDRVFRRTLVCWMLMGFANLMMLPLRVEYLANPRYGLALSVSMVALLTAVIPNLARLVMSPLWGYLFDNMNFFALRVTLNIGFAAGILAFFVSDSMAGMVLGAVIYGISNAGGDVAWGLWVTKFAPPDRTADYMSAHTFLTGVRGVLAPMAAFYLIAHVSLGLLAAMSGAMILAATMILVPEMKFSGKPKLAAD